VKPKPVFEKNRNHPRTWFRCRTVATPTCLPFCMGR